MICAGQKGYLDANEYNANKGKLGIPNAAMAKNCKSPGLGALAGIPNIDYRVSPPGPPAFRQGLNFLL